MAARAGMVRTLIVWLARPLLGLLLVLAGLGQAAPAQAADWVQNFVPTELWSGPDANAISFGTAPQWDYFQVVSPQPNGRLYVFVARTKNFAFIDAKAVGPSGPPPAGWPGPSSDAVAEAPAAPAPAEPINQAIIGPVPGFPIAADQGLWPALQLLYQLNHTWTLQALSATGTRLEWGLMSPDAAGVYQPARGLITFNVRWRRSDPRALAAVIEHEAKHVADLLAGLDIDSPAGCVTTEINAFREEAKTWGELVGPRGKANPQDDLERSLNFKLAILQQRPDAIPSLIVQNSGYQMQCHL